jgi:hypothetical protein
MGIETRSQPSGAVLEWRRDQLLAAAFPDALAVVLACDWRYDLHALVERGCEPALAARILAPLDQEARARAAAIGTRG